jgi:hypothetical protein
VPSPAPGQISNGDLKATLRNLSVIYGPERSFFFYQIIKTKSIVTFIKFRRPPPAVHRDDVGAVGRRSGASFFARYLDYCVVTRNSQPLPGLVTVTQLHRDSWLRNHLPELAKKRGTATQTAPN